MSDRQKVENAIEHLRKAMNELEAWLKEVQRDYEKISAAFEGKPLDVPEWVLRLWNNAYGQGKRK